MAGNLGANFFCLKGVLGQRRMEAGYRIKSQGTLKKSRGKSNRKAKVGEISPWTTLRRFLEVPR